MTWMIASDESGDTGRDSRFFTMAAVISMRPRYLLSAAKPIPQGDSEFKFYKAFEELVKSILREVADSQVSIVYVTVDKYDHTSRFYGMHGNLLYSSVLRELMKTAMEATSGHDVNVFVDGSSFITIRELKELVSVVSDEYKCNVKKCEKSVSHLSRCVQIADLVVGAIQRYYENGESDFINIIMKKVSVARKL